MLKSLTKLTKLITLKLNMKNRPTLNGLTNIKDFHISLPDKILKTRV